MICYCTIISWALGYYSWRIMQYVNFYKKSVYWFIEKIIFIDIRWVDFTELYWYFDFLLSLVIRLADKMIFRRIEQIITATFIYIAKYFSYRATLRAAFGIVSLCCSWCRAFIFFISTCRWFRYLLLMPRVGDAVIYILLFIYFSHGSRDALLFSRIATIYSPAIY